MGRSGNFDTFSVNLSHVQQFIKSKSAKMALRSLFMTNTSGVEKKEEIRSV
jgi:hypothetical protein